MDLSRISQLSQKYRLTDISQLRWFDLLMRAQEGDCEPLADALRDADPADVPRDVLTFVADVLAKRKLPRRKAGIKARLSDDRLWEMRMIYLWHRQLLGKSEHVTVTELGQMFSLSPERVRAHVARLRRKQLTTKRRLSK